MYGVPLSENIIKLYLISLYIYMGAIFFKSPSFQMQVHSVFIIRLYSRIVNHKASAQVGKKKPIKCNFLFIRHRRKKSERNTIYFHKNPKYYATILLVKMLFETEKNRILYIIDPTSCN